MSVAFAGYPLRKPSSGERCMRNFQAVSISGGAVPVMPLLNAIAHAAGQRNRQHQDSQNAHVLISRSGDIKAEANAAGNSERSCNIQSLPPAQHSFSAPAGVNSLPKPQNASAAFPGSRAGHRICPRHICVARRANLQTEGAPVRRNTGGDTACAGMFSRMGKMRRPRFIRSISRYRVAQAGKPAVSKCKLRTFKMRRSSFGRTGQSSRQWLGKNWRKAAATSSLTAP